MQGLGFRVHAPPHAEASALVSEDSKLMRFAHPRLRHNLESTHWPEP